MAEVVVMVGLQGCGKSTWVKQHLAGSHVVVSRKLWPGAEPREQRRERAVADALADGLDVVVDDPNPSPVERSALIAIARRHGARVRAVHVDTPAAECAARMASRPGRAPARPAGTRPARRQVVAPSLTEGFDEVRTISSAPPAAHTA